MSNELKVFVSYSRKHAELVHSLILELQATGIAADLTDEEKSPDEPRWKEVIDKADAVVFLIDSRLEPSPIERAEWQAALEASWKDPKKWLIPVLIGNTDVPSFLSNRMGIRLRRPKQEMKEAAKQIARLLRGEPSISAETLTTEREARAKREERLRYIEEIASPLEDSSRQGS